MSAVTKEIAVLVRLRGGSAFAAQATQVSRSIKGISNAADESKLSSLSTSFSKWSSSLMGVGRALLPVSAGIAGIGYESSKAATTFQKNMTLLVTQANYPRKHIQGLTKDILALSSAVGQTPGDLSAAAYWPASGGPSQQKQMASILKYAAWGAAIGQDSVSDNAKAMSQIMSTGFMSNNPKALMALMDTVVGQGHMQLGDLISATSTGIMPILKLASSASGKYHLLANGGLNQMYAMLAALSSTGVSPTQAASRLRLTYTSMMSPTTAGANALAGVGLSNVGLANDLQRGGMMGALGDLLTHMQERGYNRNQENNLLSAVFSRSRGFSSMASLLTMMSRIQQITTLDSGGGNLRRFDTHYAEARKTTAFTEQRLKATFEKSMIVLGQTVNKTLLPVLTDLAKQLTSVTNWFSKLSPATKRTIVDFGGLLAILAPALILLASFFKLISGVLWVFGKLWRVVTWGFEILSSLWEVCSVAAAIIGEGVAVAAALFAGIVLLVGVVLAVAFIFRKQLWDAIKAVAGVIGGAFLPRAVA